MSADPVAAADALVAAAHPGLDSPGVQRRDVVLVTGPWLAGTSALTAALREQMPDQEFVEPEVLGSAEAPAAVLFVVSAIAPVTESDCLLADLAARHTDLVVGVVSKTDANRGWRKVLAADRDILAQRASRYRDVAWVGAAAAPDLGEPRLDELVGLLRERLDDPDLARRNRLRAWESGLESAIARYRADGAGADREARVAALRARRDDILRERRLSKSRSSIALRSQIQQARVQLTHFARNRCTSVRAELQEDASNTSRRRLHQFETYVRSRCGGVVDDVDEGCSEHLGDVAAELGLSAPVESTAAKRPVPELPAPSLKSRRLETRLMMLLGAGFGLGVALAVSRLFSGVSPGLTVAGLVAGGVLGLLLTVSVVGIRGLLHDRAVLDRWVTDVTTTLRAGAEEYVAVRVLAAESAFSSELAARDDVDASTMADRIAEIDSELREHAIATARAAAVRDRRLPSLDQALGRVRRALYSSSDD